MPETFEGIKALARERALPNTHGLQIVIGLAMHGPSAGVNYVRNLVIQLFAAADDTEKALASIDALFKNAPLQSNRSATEFITDVTRFCLSRGLPAGTLLAIAGSAANEVKAILSRSHIPAFQGHAPVQKTSSGLQLPPVQHGPAIPQKNAPQKQSAKPLLSGGSAKNNNPKKP